MVKRTDGEVKAYVDGYNACYEKFVEILLGRNGVNTAIRKMEMLKTAVNNTILSDSSNLSAPIKAEWIDDDEYLSENTECSNCGFLMLKDFKEKCKYCPNCGAKMK